MTTDVVVAILLTLMVVYAIGLVLIAMLAALRDIATALREVRDAIYFLVPDDGGDEGDDAEIDNTAPVKPEERPARPMVS